MTLTPKHEELFRTAHRVWTQYNGGITPSLEDVQQLKGDARPNERRFRIDDLAYAIIRRELTQ